MLRTTKRTRHILFATPLLIATLAVPASGFFGPDTERPLARQPLERGEWVRSAFAAQYDKTCSPNGCIEWCLESRDGSEPSGILCSADETGNCIPGTVFSPGQ